MGMSLKQYAFYGWHIGHEDDLELDSEFDYHDFSEKDLKFLRIEAAYYYDYPRFFAVIADRLTYDGDPIKEADLSEVVKSLKVDEMEKVAKDIERINDVFGVELEGLPQWWFAPEYF